jgi:hypothetical protein
MFSVDMSTTGWTHERYQRTRSASIYGRLMYLLTSSSGYRAPTFDRRVATLMQDMSRQPKSILSDRLVFHQCSRTVRGGFGS